MNTKAAPKTALAPVEYDTAALEAGFVALVVLQALPSPHVQTPSIKVYGFSRGSSPPRGYS